MCGFLSPKVAQVDQGAAEARAKELQAQRDQQAKDEAEKKRQELGKAQGRASLLSRTGATGVLLNKKTSLFVDQAK